MSISRWFSTVCVALSFLFGYWKGGNDMEMKYQAAQLQSENEILKAKDQVEKEAAEKVARIQKEQDAENEKLKSDYDNSISTLRAYYARMLKQRRSEAAGGAMPETANPAGSSQGVRADHDEEGAQRARENLLDLAQKCDKIIIEHNALVRAVNGSKGD